MSTIKEFVIWHRFEITYEGKVMKLKIQSVPKGKEEDVIQFLFAHIHEEVFFKSCAVAQSTEALEEYKNLMVELLKTGLTLICCLDNGDDSEDQPMHIVGLNMLHLCLKKNEERKLNVQSKEMKMFFNVIEHVSKPNIFDEYKVQEYIGGAGLVVDPKYRGCGIAAELLKARQPLCKYLGISVTMAVFTSGISQRAAERAGYKTIFSVDYKTLSEMCGGLTFLTEWPAVEIKALQIS